MNCKNLEQWRSKRFVGHGNPAPTGSLLVRKVAQLRSGACTYEPRTNHFSGSQSVERERTGSRLGTGSEPAPKMRWWKRGNSDFQIKLGRQGQSCELYDQHLHLVI